MLLFDPSFCCAGYNRPICICRFIHLDQNFFDASKQPVFYPHTLSIQDQSSRSFSKLQTNSLGMRDFFSGQLIHPWCREMMNRKCFFRYFGFSCLKNFGAKIFCRIKCIAVYVLKLSLIHISGILFSWGWGSTHIIQNPTYIRGFSWGWSFQKREYILFAIVFLSRC